MYTIKIIEDQKIWGDFLNACEPNTFLHSWNWGEFNSAMGDRVWRLGIYNTEGHGELRKDTDEKLIGVASIIKVQAKRGSFLFCPHGPVVIKTLKHESIKILLDQLVEYLKVLAKKEKCGFIRFSPLMLNTPENNQLWHDFGFREAPIHMHPELAWILDISKSEDEILKNMRKNTRYAIKKAEKDGVKIIISKSPADLDKFWAIYKKTVTRQNFTPFSKNYLQTEFKIFNNNDQARWFFAEYQGIIISAAMIIFQKNSAFYHQGASDHKYPTITASHLLQWQVIQEAKKRGCKLYNFWGVVPQELKHHPWAGLSLFKRGFGGFSEEYTHAKDLPLKQSYWITYIIETIRRVKRGL